MCAGNIAKAAGIGARTAENGYIKAVEKTSAAGAAGKLAAAGGAAVYISDKMGNARPNPPEKSTEGPPPLPTALPSTGTTSPFDVLHADDPAYRKWNAKQRAEMDKVLGEMDATIAAQEVMDKKANSRSALRVDKKVTK